MAHINEAGVQKICEICDRYASEKTPLMMILSDIQNALMLYHLYSPDMTFFVAYYKHKLGTCPESPIVPDNFSEQNAVFSFPFPLQLSLKCLFQNALPHSFGLL